MAFSNTAERAGDRVSGRQIYALFLLCGVGVFSNVDRNMLGLVMPHVMADLELSNTMMGLVVGLPFVICYVSFAIPLAWVADNYERRSLLGGALLGWSVVTALTGMVQNGWQLAMARLALGAGEAAGHPTITSLIADSFNVQRRAVAFSAYSATTYLGPLIGFPIVGWLIAVYGWRSAYYVMGGLGMLFAILFLATMKEPVRDVPVAKGAAKQPFFLSIVRLLKMPTFLLVIAAGGFNAINQGAHLTWAPTFLDRVHGLSPTEIGFYFGTLRGLTGVAGAIIAAVGIGILVRRDLRWQIWAPMAVTPLPFFSDLLFLFSGNQLLWLFGLGFSAFASALLVSISFPLYVNIVPANLRATASALYFLIVALTGFMFGPFVVGALTDALTPHFGVQSIGIAMAIASASILVSALMLILANRNWIDDARRAEAQ